MPSLGMFILISKPRGSVVLTPFMLRNIRQFQGQGRPPCRVLKNPDQRKTNLSEKSALVNLLLCDFWIWFGF